MNAVLLERMVSVPMVLLLIFAIVFLVFCKNSWKWNAELKRFDETKDYRRFREKLIPLSRQKFNFVVQMKAQVNLTWIHSYLGESEEAKTVSLQVIRQNKNLIGTTMAYAVLIQELILEQNWEEAQKHWKDAMEICDTEGTKAPVDSLKLHIFGCILQKEYEEAIQLLEDVPSHLEHWAKESEAGLFWTWYLHRALGTDADKYAMMLQELPVMHQGFLREMQRGM